MALLRTTALSGGSSKKLFLGFGEDSEPEAVGAKKNGMGTGEKKLGF